RARLQGNPAWYPTCDDRAREAHPNLGGQATLRFDRLNSSSSRRGLRRADCSCRFALKSHERLLKIFHFWQMLALARRDRVPFGSQALRLRLHSTRKLFVQAAVISYHSPVRRHLLSPVLQVFFCCLCSDANEDAGSQRTRNIDAVIARKPRADFGNRDELSVLRFSNERINIQWLGYQHRAI